VLQLTTALLGLLAAILAGVLAWQLGLRRGETERRRLQRQLTVWEKLRPALVWECDAYWRVTRVDADSMPEREATAAKSWLGRDLRQLVEDAPWGRTAAGCHELLAAQGHLRGQMVRLHGLTASYEAHARPLLDDGGAWQGYLGVFVFGGVNDDGPLVHALMDSPHAPVLLLRRSTEHAPWAAQVASAQGRAWLAEATPVGGANGDWLARLPQTVRETLAALPSDGETRVDGWWLRPAGEPQANGACTVLVYAPAEPAPTDPDDALSFSYTLSHDLRAPVRVVEGFTRIVKEDYGTVLDRVGNDHLDRVLGAAARMNQMIDALLAMARLSTQPLARQSVNLSRLAQFVIDDLRRGAPERGIEVAVEPDLIVTGDPTLLRQLLENLLGNAWKYTQRSLEPRLSLTASQIDGRRTFVVRDNGAGFDMRGVDRLFGLFQRLHSASDFPGTGVGRASVKRIVNRPGGRIWAEAEPGKGASFYFTLRE
jgi:signal transduction histidine kinase